MRKSNGVQSILLISVIILLCACNFRPEALAGLFATTTPTATPFPTATLTPKATNTPIAPLNLNSCAFAFYCPDSLSIFSLLGEDRGDQINYYVEIPYDLPVIFHAGQSTYRHQSDIHLPGCHFFGSF